MTKKCILLARSKTKLPFELIIVETCTNYLSEFADIHIYERYKTTDVVSINRGFFASKSDYSVLLTNDVYVSDGWLECLLDCFNRHGDCGLSTLATDQFGHEKSDVISEGIWFSVAMIPKRYAMFSEDFPNSWSDTDLVMNVYDDGYKMYRNYNCVVSHKVGATQYLQKDHDKIFNKNKEFFISKWYNTKCRRIYDILTQGIVI